MDSGQTPFLTLLFLSHNTHTHTHTHTHRSWDSDSDDRVFHLASPVISASFQCDTCTTSNLSTPVQVTFTHTHHMTRFVYKHEVPQVHFIVCCVYTIRRSYYKKTLMVQSSVYFGSSIAMNQIGIFIKY